MRHLPVLLAMLCALACGKENTAPTITLVGSWFGADAMFAPYPVLSMTLSESGNTVTGSGNLDGSPVTITGTSGTTTTLNLAATGKPVVTYTVAVLLPTSMMGRLNGGGYSNHVLSLDRR